MELFGIVLSIPVAFVASMLYCLLLAKIVSKSAMLSRWLRMASYAVLGLFAVEILLLVTIAPVRARGLIGPGFYVAHLVFFFLCPPGLAVAGALCTVLAFCLVLLQYGVSEALYGIDGDDGPYSSRVAPTNLESPRTT